MKLITSTLLLFFFTSRVIACADIVVKKTFHKLKVEYIGFCPYYESSEKLSKFLDSLETLQSPENTNVLILINKIRFLPSDEVFIALAMDSLVNFQRDLAQDYNSYITYPDQWESQSYYKAKVPFLRSIHYPMNINITRTNSISKYGLKIIYNYPSNEPIDCYQDSIHANNLIRLLKWGLENTEMIQKNQVKNIYAYEQNGWKLSVHSISNKQIVRILTPPLLMPASVMIALLLSFALLILVYLLQH